MTIALSLTLIRVLLSPIFLILYLHHQYLGISQVLLPFILLALLLCAEISDLLDGMFARMRNQVTELGKILDPMADSIFRLSVYLAFTQGVVQLPLWLVLFFFYRDSMISTLRTVCALRGVVLSARLSGKIKAVIQAAGAFFILLLMVPYVFGWISLEQFQTISFYTLLFAVSYSLFSGVEYIVANQPYIRKALTQ